MERAVTAWRGRDDVAVARSWQRRGRGVAEAWLWRGRGRGVAMARPWQRRGHCRGAAVAEAWPWQRRGRGAAGGDVAFAHAGPWSGCCGRGATSSGVSLLPLSSLLEIRAFSWPVLGSVGRMRVAYFLQPGQPCIV